MKTILTTSPAEAAQFIRRGGIVAFPTETVYGLGANVFDETAIAKIFAAKKRPNDNPLIAHVGDVRQIETIALKVNTIARRFIDVFFPAPLTLVLPKAKNVPLIATANLETIGVRMPRCNAALEFLNACRTPIVAPSANLSGKPSPTDWRAVFEDLDGRIDCILQGDATEIGLESTVLDCTGDVPLVLRTGAVTLEELREVEPRVELYITSTIEKPRSPGLKHRHYSPRAKVVLVESAKFEVDDLKTSAFIGLSEPETKFALVEICDSVDGYAHSVFEFFRRCDRANVATIYCENAADEGIGLALMDRLKRAAAG